MAHIKLSQTAPWNPRLINGYKDRYTEAGGRYFKVHAEYIGGIWYIEEIDKDGESLWQNYSDLAFTLAEARQKIAAEAGTAE
jgi:hypothetical protein